MRARERCGSDGLVLLPAAGAGAEGTGRSLSRYPTLCHLSESGFGCKHPKQQSFPGSLNGRSGEKLDDKGPTVGTCVHRRFERSLGSGSEMDDRMRTWHMQWFTEIWCGVMIGLAVPTAFVLWMTPELRAPSPPWLLSAFGGLGGLVYALALPRRRVPKMLWLLVPGVVYVLVGRMQVRVPWQSVAIEAFWCGATAHLVWLVTTSLQRRKHSRPSAGSGNKLT